MKKVNRILNDFGWPIVIGLLCALLIFTLRPQWLNSQWQAQIINSSEPTKIYLHRPASYALAVKKASPSVVNIYTQKILPGISRFSSGNLFQQLSNQNDAAGSKRKESSLGSGVIVTSDGYILTNNHVIDGADEALVQLEDGREGNIKLIGVNRELDLAVLKINLDHLTPIKLADSSKTQVGDVVLAIGNPFGVGQSVSQGIISATHRKGSGQDAFQNLIQTDAAINPGNSGGALVDTDGNLVGINVAILNPAEYAMGISFAIPANTAIKSFIAITSRGWLGIEANELKLQAAKSLGLKPPSGLVIKNIFPDSPAFSSGLLPGDIIVRVNATEIINPEKTMDMIGSLSPGDSLQLDILRNGKIKPVSIVAGVRPGIN